jgi:hypothetical protein
VAAQGQEALPTPDGSYSPAQKGELLLRYVSTGTPVAKSRDDRLDFSSTHLPPGASLAGAKLAEANLIRAVLTGVNMQKAWLVGANFGGADLIGAQLQGASLTWASLWDADLRVADLTGAHLQQAFIEGVNLNGAILREVDLGDCRGVPLDLAGCEIDVATYRRSSWAPNRVLACHRAGANLVDFPEAWPDDVVKLIIGTTGGLTLFFDTRITPFDRFLVDGVIFGVLGRDTDCHVAEFKEQAASAVVRLVARNPDDLVVVAEALYQRVWEAGERTQERALARMGDVLRLQKMGSALSGLVDRLDRLEMWLDEHDILDLLASQGDAHYKGRMEKVTTPTGVKVAKAGLKLVRKWLLKDADELVHGELKDVASDAVKGLNAGKKPRS